MTIQKIRSGRVTSINADEYIGEKGTIFYNETIGDLRLSDGITPGGVGLSVGSGGGSGNASIISSPTAPGTDINGTMWWNSTEQQLYVRYQHAWHPANTIDTASVDRAGTVKIGNGINISADGTISVEYSLGGEVVSDLYPPEDGTINIGHPDLRFKSIHVLDGYFSAHTVYIGGVPISASGDTLVLPGNTTIGGVNPGAIKVRGTLPSTNDLLLLPHPMIGDGYVIDGNLWVCTVDYTTSLSDWVDVGSIAGPQGPQGPQGIPGDSNYNLPPATTTSLGGIKVGSGLTIIEDGTLSTDRIYEFSQMLTITTDWQDVGVNADQIGTGTYIIQVKANDYNVGGGHHSEYYSATMSWYGASTNSTVFDEVALHRAGNGPGTGALFLRVQRTENSANNLKLQISGITDNTGSSLYVFKLRQML